MSHLFSLERPWPICFPWTSLALFLILHSHGLLLSSLGFPGPIALSLILGAHGLAITPYFLCFHYFGFAVAHSYFSTSYIAHGFFYFYFFFSLSFWAPLSPFTPSRPICLSHGPVIHYSCHLASMGFLTIYQLFFVRVARLLLSTWASKMAINKIKLKL